MPAALVHSEHRGDRLRHQGGVDERCQLDQPDAVGILRLHRVGHALRQSRLADAAGSGQDHQPIGGEQPAHFGKF